MAFVQKEVALGTGDTTIFTMPATTAGSAHGIVFSNITGSAVTVGFKVYSLSTGLTVTLAAALAVAANTPLAWPKPVNMNAGDQIIASCSVASAITAVVSLYTATSNPVAVGFTLRGTYSGGATYSINDVVVYLGSTYVCLVAATTATLPTVTTNWMFLAQKGDSALSVTYTDKGNSGTTTQTLDYSVAQEQKITVTGAFTIATSNWPSAGNLGEMLIKLVNGAAFAITWPTINWVKADGSTTTTFSANGVTLQTSGTDFVMLWSDDGGTTIYGKVGR